MGLENPTRKRVQKNSSNGLFSWKRTLILWEIRFETISKYQGQRRSIYIFTWTQADFPCSWSTDLKLPNSWVPSWSRDPKPNSSTHHKSHETLIKKKLQQKILKKILKRRETPGEDRIGNQGAFDLEFLALLKIAGTEEKGIGARKREFIHKQQSKEESV